MSKQFFEYTLPNGVRLIAEPIPYFRSVAVGIWVRTGSVNEREEQNGYSHFIEHMLFKGTGRRSAMQISSEIDEIGGQLNAFTSKECTCYYATVRDEHIDIAMDVLSDCLLYTSLWRAAALPLHFLGRVSAYKVWKKRGGKRPFF